jgi:hypothetical protein
MEHSETAIIKQFYFKLAPKPQITRGKRKELSARTNISVKIASKTFTRLQEKHIKDIT